MALTEGVMEAIFVLLFALIFYVVYRALRGSSQPTGTQPETPRIAFHGNSYPFSEIQADPNFPHVRSIHTKIRGVTHANPDGANRQDIIRQWCRSGDALYLVREPKNPADSNAIQVRRIVCSDAPDKPVLGEQLGYLSRELAEKLAPNIDEHGFVLMAKIMDVTGGDYGRSLGVNIQIEEYEPALQADPSQPKKPASHRKKNVLPAVSQ